ncbi:hypothetical protein A33Q_0856 [Indibacter alkaliphilus LW1]|uniref:Uncharacterized protein n=1 Tax=Indibacter alkaliphilus (strain CCUG 57479 / KCTC 22604 / LW1) TaxID=1189612 RepID=S2E3C7_INDAL|nr:hypothetical protein A33Q_0856 [Indibacter alkaliphilus LW1]
METDPVIVLVQSDRVSDLVYGRFNCISNLFQNPFKSQEYI